LQELASERGVLLDLRVAGLIELALSGGNDASQFHSIRSKWGARADANGFAALPSCPDTGPRQEMRLTDPIPLDRLEVVETCFTLLHRSAAEVWKRRKPVRLVFGRDRLDLTAIESRKAALLDPIQALRHE